MTQKILKLTDKYTLIQNSSHSPFVLFKHGERVKETSEYHYISWTALSGEEGQKKEITKFAKEINDIYNQLQKANARIAELEAANEWQPIEKLKDVELENFMVANFNDKPAFISVAWKPFDYTGKWVKCTGGSLVGVHNLTHWKPIPTPPKKENV